MKVENDATASNYFISRDDINESMRKLYPIAAIDVETAAYY